MSNYLIPYVIEKTREGERSYDLYSRLLRERIVFVGTEINSQVSNAVVAQLLFLAKENSEKDITMYVNSPGGSVYAGLAIIDTMKYIKPDVVTVCVGMAASMGGLILSSGQKGKRLALPNSMIHMHQPIQMGGGGASYASDVEINAKEILRLKDVLAEMLADNTNTNKDQILKDFDRDYNMTAQQAKEYGFIDKIVTNEQLA